MSDEAKAGFELPEDLHYLNCAYMSPLHPSVEEAGIVGMRKKRLPHRIGPDDFFRESDELRELFAGLVGAADRRSVAILPAASYGLAVAARNAGSVAGRSLVVARDQFPGNVYPWLSLAAREGGALKIVDPPSGGVGTPGRGAGWTERLLDAIDDTTAVVSLGPVHWTDGTRFDLDRIGERAREVGALFVVDATQTVGAIPIDVQRLRPDALICAGYKWMLGPYSIALGFFGERLRSGIPLEEGWIAREGSEDFQRLVEYQERYQPGAIRFDVGERSNFILVPMMVAALKLVLRWTPGRIAAHARRLNTTLADELQARGFGVEEEGWRADHILGVGMRAGVELGALRDALRQRNVHISLRGEALRISPHLYNSEDDLEALLRAVDDLE